MYAAEWKKHIPIFKKWLLHTITTSCNASTSSMLSWIFFLIDLLQPDDTDLISYQEDANTWSWPHFKLFPSFLDNHILICFILNNADFIIQTSSDHLKWIHAFSDA